MKFRRSRLSQALAAALGLGVPWAHAQVVRDGTMGASGAIAPTAISHPRFAGEIRIGASDGQQRGANLFHSFSQFDIAQNLRATFQGPADVGNIISRVTGGTPSLILGGLRSEIAGANLFLLNPQGIFFGQNAVLDVTGSFYASTAHYLALADGGRFDTSVAGSTVLTSAPPSAFGFVGPPADIVVNRSTLTGAPGKTLAFVAGPMTLTGAAIEAPGGTLSLLSVGGSGEAPIAGGEPVLAAGMVRAAIDLTNTTLDATTTPAFSAGKVVIRGGKLTMTNNTVVGLANDRAGAAQGVLVDASESLTMVSALIGTSTSGTGSGGPVVVSSPTITLQDSLISSISTGPGTAGAVSVSGNIVSLSGQSFISSTVFADGPAGGVEVFASESLTIAGSAGARSGISSASDGTGAAGTIAIASPTVLLDGGVVTSTVSGPGAAGPIRIDANRVTLSSGARIDSSSSGAGAAGAIAVVATESITVAGDADRRSGIGSSATAGGAGGGIVLAAPLVDLVSAEITASSAGAGAAGSIAVIAGELASSGSLLDASGTGTGAAGNIDVVADRVVLRDNSVLNSSAVASAPGSIAITAGESISILRGNGDPTGFAGLFSVNLGAQAGSAVSLAAPTITIDGTSVNTRAFGSGRAGDIRIEAGRLSVLNGAQVDSQSQGAGAAGNLVVSATESIDLAGRAASGQQTQLSSSATASGRGGNITLSAPAITLSDAIVTANGEATGSPGNITLTGETIAITEGGGLSSSSIAPGAGGTVTINASRSFTLAGQNVDGQRSLLLGINFGEGSGTSIAVSAPDVTLDEGLVTTLSVGSGPGGSIAVDGARVTLSRGGQISSATLGAGRAGDTRITATESIAMSGRFDGEAAGITARSAGSGDGGTVTLSAPSITLDGGVVAVGAEGTGRAGSIVVDAGTLLMKNAARLDTSAFASGAGGTIDVTATESVTLMGNGGNTASAISTVAFGGAAAGEIRITAPEVSVAGGTISGETRGAGAGGNININAARVSITDKGTVASDALGSGAGGRVIVTASESVSIAAPPDAPFSTGITAAANGSAVGGDIDITAPVVTMSGGLIAASALAQGDAGSVSVRGSRFAVSGGGFVDSSGFSSGNAGRVFVDMTESIALSGRNANGNPSTISSSAFGTGNGGQVFLRAPLITLSNEGFVGVDAQGGGSAGEINVQTNRLVLESSGNMSSSAFGPSTGGRISITATGALSISDTGATFNRSGLFATTTGSGRGGEIEVHAPRVSLTGGTISTTTAGGGDAGRIFIDAANLDVARGAVIDSSTLGAGAGGIVNVIASESITVSGRNAADILSTISSFSSGPGAGGDIFLTTPTLLVDGGAVLANAAARGAAGRMNVDVQRLTIANGGLLASGTSGAGNGGTLFVNASESIVVTGASGESRSRITNSSSGAGDAGEIFLTAPSMSVQDSGFIRGTAGDSGNAGTIRVRTGTLALGGGGEISTSTTAGGRGGAVDVVATNSVAMTDSSVRSTSAGSGDAGNIAIDAGRSLTMVRSAITTEANRADGGNILIKAIDLLRLTDSQITTSVGSGFGNGGNINIDPTFVILDSSRIIANAFGGNGGNINIVTDALVRSGDSVIEASSQLGVQGTIRISAPDSDLVGSLTPLTGGLFDPSQLLRASCSARAAAGGNSFVGVGHGGLPERPGALAFSSYAPTRAIEAGERAPVYALLNEFSCAR